MTARDHAEVLEAEELPWDADVLDACADDDRAELLAAGDAWATDATPVEVAL